MKSTAKFNPQPGDKIICNNGEEFICCTLENLNSKGFASYLKDEVDVIFGISENWENDHSWMYWEGNNYPNDYKWKIREVIPKSLEALVDKKEEVKEELRYTVEEVIEAFSNALHLSWMGGHKEGIEKVKDYLEKKSNKEYQEYLRLKAIYE